MCCLTCPREMNGVYVVQGGMCGTARDVTISLVPPAPPGQRGELTCVIPDDLTDPSYPLMVRTPRFHLPAVCSLAWCQTSADYIACRSAQKAGSVWYLCKTVHQPSVGLVHVPSSSFTALSDVLSIAVGATLEKSMCKHLAHLLCFCSFATSSDL